MATSSSLGSWALLGKIVFTMEPGASSTGLPGVGYPTPLEGRFPHEASSHGGHGAPMPLTALGERPHMI